MGNSITVHGGQVFRLAKELGRPVESLIDFSASVNPLGPPVSVLNAMHEAINECQYYPDPYSDDLRVQLAQKHKVSVESILVGNGSVELIRILPQALRLQQACVVGPTFSEFEHALQLARIPYLGVEGVSNHQYAPPVEKVHTILQRWKLGSSCKKPKGGVRPYAVYLCNPNSPTGRRIAPRDLQEIIAQVHQVGGWMIVDEAFIDWCPSYSLLKDLSKWPRLLILRSFTKFFAIPGLRLGYLVGEPSVIETIGKYMPPWSVNRVAQAAGMAALADLHFCGRSQRFMQRARGCLIRELGTIPELRVIPSQANFVMVEFSDDLVMKDIVVRLQNQGILVRDCQTFSGMTHAALRFTVRLQRDNQRLVRALKKMLKI